MRSRLLSIVAGLLGACQTLPSPAPKPDPFLEATANAQKRQGLLSMYVDARSGKVMLELPPGAQGVVGAYLYVESLATGLGSNPVGLDRGQLGETRVVTLRLMSGQLLIEAQNQAYRAHSDAPPEIRATRESFANSVLWAGPVTARAADGRALVDITSFIVRDAHGIAARLKQTGQGSYSLDAKRSLLRPDSVLAFPHNVALEAMLTFSSRTAGSEVDATSATGLEFTVVQRHGFIRLPDDGYTPRRFHPRSGSFDVAFADYAAPLAADLKTRYVVRHRLSADKPLIYYVDRGIPEPVRSAVVEGASWWSEAFAAAGFPNTFRVELLPEGVHPLDVRYNVIQWVHRATRGWSYGFGVIDPRTGEIVKGHVSLGSLRVRQDRMIFEGLLGTDKTATNAPDDPIQLALARIRQLAAHEVGHTLGFAHNFAASSRDRASVMDYPAPWVQIKDGQLDVSQAYAVGIGTWDKLATRYAYQQFEDETAGLAQIIAEAEQSNHLFITDADARAPGSAHPLANLWDNGPDPIAALREALDVRAVAMRRFGAQNLLPETPLAGLEEVFAPIYFYHRYQLEAATKSVAGVRYTYALKEEPDRVAAIVDAPTQRRALRAVLEAIAPEALDISEATLQRLLPRAFGLDRNREQFASATRPTFDALGAARTAANMAISGLLQRERAARLIDQHRRRRDLPGLTEVIDALIDAAFARPRSDRLRSIQNEVQQVLVARLSALAADRSVRHGLRAESEAALIRITARLKGRGAHEAFLLSTIRRFLRRDRDAFEIIDIDAPPPGSPIGASWSCAHNSSP